MKTIFVVYTNSCKIDTKCTTLKKYAFNTESEVKVGDRLISASYDTRMIVTDILDKSYEFYNKNTGKLSNKLDSTEYRTIKTLKVADENYDVVARKIE